MPSFTFRLRETVYYHGSNPEIPCSPGEVTRFGVNFNTFFVVFDVNSGDGLQPHWKTFFLYAPQLRRYPRYPVLFNQPHRRITSWLTCPWSPKENIA